MPSPVCLFEPRDFLRESADHKNFITDSIFQQTHSFIHAAAPDAVARRNSRNAWCKNLYCKQTVSMIARSMPDCCFLPHTHTLTSCFESPSKFVLPAPTPNHKCIFVLQVQGELGWWPGWDEKRMEEHVAKQCRILHIILRHRGCVAVCVYWGKLVLTLSAFDRERSVLLLHRAGSCCTCVQGGWERGFEVVRYTRQYSSISETCLLCARAQCSLLSGHFLCPSICGGIFCRQFKITFFLRV